MIVETTPLSPNPDKATATAIAHLTEGAPDNPPSWTSRLQPQTQPSQADANRHYQNYCLRMRDAGYTDECNYMLKNLFRRYCLQEAAYIKIMEAVSHEQTISSLRKLTTTAKELNDQMNETLNIIYRIKSDQRDGLDPLLLRRDMAAVNEPRPVNAVGILGQARAVAVEPS